MNNKLENEVNSIVKFVTEMFHPDDVWVEPYDNPERYSIIIYFNDVDDKYITNPLHGNQKEHKANMFNREIRTYIQNFLGIKTSGVQPPHFHSPEETHPISIYVRYIV
jgi:hypothetical protein